MAVVLLAAVLLVANMMTTPEPAQNAAAPAAAASRRTGAGRRARPAAPAAAAPAPAPRRPAVAEKAYTGRSAGNEVTVAIAVKDGKAVAYVCDGKKIEAWMEGTLAGDKLVAAGQDRQPRSATVDEKATLGSVDRRRQAEWPFSAKGVAAPAGLYQGRGVRQGRRRPRRLDRGGERQRDGAREVGNGTEPAPVIDPARPRPSRSTAAGDRRAGRRRPTVVAR